MLKKLQTKFIILTLSALFIVLTVIMGCINGVNYYRMLEQTEQILSILAENEGTFPEFKKEPSKKETPDSQSHPEHQNSSDSSDFQNDKTVPSDHPDKSLSDLPGDMSEETPYETRFFSVVFQRETSAVVQAETGRIVSVDTATAIEYGQTVLESGKTIGFLDNFRYLCYEEDEHIRIVFLDCGRRLDAVRDFFLVSTGISFLGFSIVALIILFFSNRIIRPISESYEKQKRFITDAGHEIKTPLTIINADADILEMELGENEWIADIHKQTRRLTELTNYLILLSRMEESADTITKVEFPISDVVREAALSFQALAQTQNKKLECDISPMLSMYGDSKGIHQLTGLLLDNAIKYSPDESRIFISLQEMTGNKALRLTVTNQTLYPITKEQLSQLFERFYRPDSSRATSTGGYGIGLSVAKAITAAHGGKIKACLKEENVLEIQVQLPVS